MTNWTIHKLDGQYLGQASAVAHQVAFCLVMVILGKECLETDLQCVELADNHYRITYNAEEFLVRRDQSGNFVGAQAG